MSRLPSSLRSRASVAAVGLAAAFLVAGVTQNLAAQSGGTTKPPAKRPTTPIGVRQPGQPTLKPAPTPPPAPDSAKAAAAPAPKSTLATVSGTVYDSVHAGPLRQATVKIDGATAQALTDNNGRYRLDSIPAGPHHLRVDHVLLDSLGVQMVTNEFTLEESESKIIDLSIPSMETLVSVSCPAARRALGPSAIIGRLLDADTDAPVAGVRVSFAWSEISITTGLRPIARLRDAMTGVDGVFRVCGLPNQVEGTLQADRKGITTSEVTIKFEGQPLIIQGLRIGNAQTVTRAETDTTKAPARDASQGPRFSANTLQKGQASLRGRVVTAAGTPVVGARVDVQGTNGATLTKENGEFFLTELPSGTQTVIARQIGYEPVEHPVELSTRAPAFVTITMSKPAQVLAPVVVKAQSQGDGLTKLGFTDRKRSGAGYFVDADEIMKRGPNLLTDVFRTIPALKVSPGGMYGTEYVVEDARSVGTAGACVRYVIDGAPYQAIYPGDIDRLIPPWDIAGIEVYHGANVPMQFSFGGESGCAVIVIWSKNHAESAAKRKR